MSGKSPSGVATADTAVAAAAAAAAVEALFFKLIHDATARNRFKQPHAKPILGVAGRSRKPKIPATQL